MHVLSLSLSFTLSLSPPPITCACVHAFLHTVGHSFWAQFTEIIKKKKTDEKQSWSRSWPQYNGSVFFCYILYCSQINRTLSAVLIWLFWMNPPFLVWKNIWLFLVTWLVSDLWTFLLSHSWTPCRLVTHRGITYEQMPDMATNLHCCTHM